MLFIKLVLLVFAIYIVLTIFFELRYLRSTYFKITRNPRFRLLRDKGKYGEYLIWEKLKPLEKNGAKFLFNLYLPRDNGGTTEIDVLLLSPLGVFVFESKYYSGWIFGDEKSRYWTQTLPAGHNKSHKEHFLNPVFQNSLHVRCLKNIIGDEIPVHSIIVFSDHCELKRLSINMSGSIQVIQLANLPNVINGIQWNTSLTESTITALYDKLFAYTQVSKDIKEAHVAELQLKLQKELSVSENNTRPVTASEIASPYFANNEIVTEEASLSTDQAVTGNSCHNTLLCPQCGGVLVIRTAKRGNNAGSKFYGCSNYPQCRYTRSI